MLLSEAIRIGSTFRGESRSGPFIRVANSDDLLSDVYGAACEAVYSLIAKRNWNKDNKLEYDSDIEALREVQQKYFGNYFRMSAFCPGANPRVISHAGGRFTGRVVGGLNEFVIERERAETVQGVTDICPAITNLAEVTEHMFYVHNWTREECAQGVEYFEQGAIQQAVASFEHFQDSAVVKRASARLTAAAIERQLQRQQRKAYFPTH